MAKKKKVKTKTRPKSKKKSVNTKRIAGAKQAVLRTASNTVAAAHETFSANGWRKSNYKTLKEFWPFYLHEHAHASNRALHFIGSSLGLVILAVALISAKYPLILFALLSGYAFAWVGHFFIEHNRPATFKYPIKSFISDWRLWYTVFMDKIPSEFRKYGIESK
jgi:hypothetical protein